jgi:hypothetical protein
MLLSMILTLLTLLMLLILLLILLSTLLVLSIVSTILNRTSLLRLCLGHLRWYVSFSGHLGLHTRDTHRLSHSTSLINTKTPPRHLRYVFQVFKLKEADGVLQSPACQECVKAAMPCMRTPSQGLWQREKCDRCSCLRMHCSAAVHFAVYPRATHNASPTNRRRRPATKEKTFKTGSSWSTLLNPFSDISQETGPQSAFLNL